MEENLNNTPAPEEENEGIDIKALLSNLWAGRKTIFITLGIFIALGILSAVTMKRTYSVSTVMVPQMGSAKSSGLGDLAALAGFDLGSSSSSSELSPLVYPQIVNSVPFRLKLMHMPMHYQKCDTMISMLDYALAGYEKPTAMDYVLRYTIGLPGVIIGAISGEKKEVAPAIPAVPDSSNTRKPVVVTPDEQKMLDKFGSFLSLNVDKKEGTITLVTHGTEPIQTAELAMNAQQLLQEEVTRIRVEKSKSELDYIQARYYEAKEEAERYQAALAGSTDRFQDVVTTTANIGKERLRSKYNVANSIYMEMAKQLEQAKMQVKKDMPIFAVIQPVTIPMKPDNSRAKTVIVWTFLGFVLGCGIVLGKNYWHKFRASFKKTEGTKEPESKKEEEQ
jgi:LPS O-antigen subunit length determinant protein (WzzB/FepE family)